MSEIKKNDTLTVGITSVSNLGSGVGRTDGGMVVFVPGAVTGETVSVKIIKTTKSFCVGRLTDILVASPLREEVQTCTAPATCGGCAYRFITYSHECELKRQNIASEFAKAGLSDTVILPVATVKGSDGLPVTSGYRNKAQYRFKAGRDGITAGFYASGTHRVTGDGNCPLQPPVFGECVRTVCEWAEGYGIGVYDEETGRGLLRHLYLRCGSGDDGDIGVCVVINGASLPHADGLARLLAEHIPRVRTLSLNINRGNTNVILGDEYITVWGDGYIRDTFCGLEVEVSPAAFYQVNHDAAELLCRTAAEIAGFAGSEALLDLYCGIGTVGLSMADRVGSLTGIEIVPEAVECARRNAAANSVKNAEFICADSADGAARLLSRAGEKPDCVILDPPRRGCAPELLDALAAAGIPKILYISCNPATLARDAAILVPAGYAADEVHPVDLFPRTGHVESAVLLSKKQTNRNLKEKQ